MPASKAQIRFLLRGSLLVVVSLTVWWMALRAPLLSALRWSAAIPLALAGASVDGDATGGWKLRVPVSDGRAIEFTAAEADVTIFTLSLPVFWAVMLATSGVRRQWRGLAGGTLVLAVVNALSVTVFAEATAHRILGQIEGSPGGLATWFLGLSQYLVVNVTPYAAPLVTAFALHTGLRAAISVPEASGARGEGRARRG